MRHRLHPPLPWVCALALLVTAGAHIPMIPEHLQEAPYIGILFILLSVVSLALAMAIVIRDLPVVWAASGTVTLLAAVAFLLSRTVGLPQIGDDIGNWSEPLGFAALVAEFATTGMAVLAVAQSRRLATPKHY